MAVTINAKTTNVHHPAVQCDTYETVSQYVNLMPCIFISAFRGDPSREDYSEQLLKDIVQSDLSYIKCQGGLYEAFCVVNNGCCDDDFVKLGVEWCRKFENKAVLITFPVREKVNQRRLIEIVGKVYNVKGQVKEKLEFGIPFKDTDECFARVFGKPVALDDKAEIVITDLTPPATINGRFIAHTRFKNKYPSLF